MWPMFCLKCLYLVEDKRPFYLTLCSCCCMGIYQLHLILTTLLHVDLITIVYLKA